MDPLLQLACERPVDAEQPLASPPTLCRLENRARRRSLAQAAQTLVEVFVESHATAPQELILDFDATDDPVHGEQVGRFFHGYYDEYCFLPLYVFCGSQLLVAYLRPADQDAATHAWAILPAAVKHRWKPEWLALLERLRPAVPSSMQVLALADRGLYAKWLFKAITHAGWHPFLRIDASEFELLPHLVRCWMRKGKQREVRTPGKNQKVAVFGAFCYGKRLFLHDTQTSPSIQT